MSSGDLVALFEATWTDDQIKTHYAARDAVDAITAAAFQEIGRRVRNGGTNEHQMQQWFMEAFQRENLVTDDPPIVGVNAHSGNPHYEPSAETQRPFAKAILFCSTFGRRKIRPQPFITTLPGPVSLAKRRLIACAKFSTWFVMRVMLG